MIATVCRWEMSMEPEETHLRNPFGWRSIINT